MPRLIRIATVPISLHLLLQGQFEYMVAKGFDVTTISANGREVNYIVQKGIPHVVIPFTRKISPFKDLVCLWKLVREIKKIKPDIVHTHTPKAGLLGMLAAWVCRVPIRLHTVAGLPLMEQRGLKRYILNIAERITYRCANGIYPNSQGLKQFIQQEFSIPPTKLKLIGKGSSNGIDTSFFSRSSELEWQAKQLRLKYLLAEDDIVFSFVGRVVRDKGVVELISAFKEVFENDSSGELSSRKRKLHLMIVGDFEQDLDPLPSAIHEFLRNDERVIFAGFQNDVRPWMIASNIFVFPSYREGFPNVVMQAGLLGIPCIVSDINGCNEIVQHGQTGIIVPPKNISALSVAMKELLNDKDKRTKFGLAAQQFVSSNFERSVLWKELLAEYQRRLEEVGRPKQ